MGAEADRGAVVRAIVADTWRAYGIYKRRKPYEIIMADFDPTTATDEQAEDWRRAVDFLIADPALYYFRRDHDISEEAALSLFDILFASLIGENWAARYEPRILSNGG